VAEAHMGLYTKLSLAQRAGILDAHQAGEIYGKIPIESLFVPSRISVIDVSESSDIVRNIVVAHLLKEIFNYKTRIMESAPILIFMEEIHTFLSKAKRRTMTATLTMLMEMARQGRKRGIGLGMVSQQPSLVPSELIELCNTRFMHRISSEPNIEVLRKSTGNVPDSLWSLLPSMGKGEVLISSPKYYQAVVARIRPNQSKRLRTEYS
jgi:DNA helicase HerA-like ATPase